MHVGEQSDRLCGVGIWGEMAAEFETVTHLGGKLVGQRVNGGPNTVIEEEWGKMRTSDLDYVIV